MLKIFIFLGVLVVSFASIAPLHTVLIQNPGIETSIQTHSQNTGSFAYSVARTQNDLLPILHSNLYSTLHLRGSPVVTSVIQPPLPLSSVNAFQLHPFIHNLPHNTVFFPQRLENPQGPNVSVDGDSVTVEAN